MSGLDPAAARLEGLVLVLGVAMALGLMFATISVNVLERMQESSSTTRCHGSN